MFTEIIKNNKDSKPKKKLSIFDIDVEVSAKEEIKEDTGTEAEEEVKEEVKEEAEEEVKEEAEEEVKEEAEEEAKKTSKKKKPEPEDDEEDLEDDEEDLEEEDLEDDQEDLEDKEEDSDDEEESSEAKEEAENSKKNKKNKSKKDIKDDPETKTNKSSPEKDIEAEESKNLGNSYEDMISILLPEMNDKAWVDYEEEIKEKLETRTRIDSDMNPGSLKIVIQELSDLRQEIWSNLQKLKSSYENIGAKDIGLIDRTRKYNCSGANEAERRKTGIKACMNYKTDTGICDLFLTHDIIKNKYNFLKAVQDEINYKTGIIITMSGALKLESQHLNNE